jgi:predicted nucleic acid-binding protein
MRVTLAGLTLDAGALIAFDRHERAAVALIGAALTSGIPVTIPAGVLGQVWRDGRRQARLARLLASVVVTVEPLDDVSARAAGQLCGVTGTSDVIDASVALCAKRRGQSVVTSDPDDLRRLDPTLRLITI